MRYQQTPEQEFRDKLEVKMGTITALDFTEQLLIFDACGMIYDHPQFVQATQVRPGIEPNVSVHVLTCSQLPGLYLQTWEDFVKSHDLLSLMVNS